MILIESYLGYKGDMTRNAEKRSEQILINLSPSELEAVVRVAEETDRPKGYVARELMLRGLSLYEMDGKLRGEAPAKAMRQLAPVVARIERGEMSRQDVQRMVESTETIKVPVRKKVS